MKIPMTYAFLASIACLFFLLPPASAQLPTTLQNAIDKSVDDYKTACEAADEKLIMGFDTVVNAIRKNPRIDPEAKQSVIESVTAEKLAFIKYGTIPFSPAMRYQAILHLTSIEKARITAGRAYNRGIEHYQRKEKDDVKATLLADEKRKVLTPKVVAQWDCAGTNFRRNFTWKLNADGTVGDTSDTWRFEGDKLVLRVGAHVDTCTIDGSGRKLRARNEGGGTYVGKLVDPLQQTTK